MTEANDNNVFAFPGITKEIRDEAERLRKDYETPLYPTRRSMEIMTKALTLATETLASLGAVKEVTAIGLMINELETDLINYNAYMQKKNGK